MEENANGNFSLLKGIEGIESILDNCSYKISSCGKEGCFCRTEFRSSDFHVDNLRRLEGTDVYVKITAVIPDFNRYPNPQNHGWLYKVGIPLIKDGQLVPKAKHLDYSKAFRL